MASSKAERARFREILTIIFRGGLLRGATPTKLRRTLEELGPTYVKFGQIMSMRNDLLPVEYCDELALLRSEMTALDFGQICKVVENELKRPLEELFAVVDPVAVGTASIAQVHRAVLPGGERVVLKVQRPGIYKTMANDVALLHGVFHFLRRYFRPFARGIGDTMDLDAVIDEIWATAQQELDFLIEAKNVSDFSLGNTGIVYVSAPIVYAELSTAKVLVMEDVQGIQIDELAALTEAGYDAREVGEKLVENYVKQILDDGFFQADPHPGNFVVREGKIVWLDLGMMGRLSQVERELLKRAVIGIVQNDAWEVTEVLLTLTHATKTVDLAGLRTDVGLLLAKYANMPLKNMNLGLMLQETLGIAREHALSVPGGVTMLGRGILTMQGTLVLIDPDINFIEMMRNHIYTSELLGDEVKRRLRKNAEYLLMSADKTLRIPAEIEELLRRANSGELSLHLEVNGLSRSFKERKRFYDQLLPAILCAAFSLAAAIFAMSDTVPGLAGLPWPSWVFLGAAGVNLLLLVRRHFKKKP